jgi:peptidoglycan/LPS O-acetylase OafA/YrhL
VGRWAAEAGKHTMFPYLIHLPLLTVLTWTGWPGQGPPTLTAVAAVVAAVVAAALLVTPPIRFLAGPLVEPRNWFEHRFDHWFERWSPDRRGRGPA